MANQENWNGKNWRRYYKSIFEDTTDRKTFAYKIEDAYMRSRFASSIRQYAKRQGLEDKYTINIPHNSHMVVVRKVG